MNASCICIYWNYKTFIYKSIQINMLDCAIHFFRTCHSEVFAMPRSPLPSSKLVGLLILLAVGKLNVDRINKSLQYVKHLDSPCEISNFIRQGRSQKGVGGGPTERSGPENHSRFTTCTSCKEASRRDWIDFESRSWCLDLMRNGQSQQKGLRWCHTYPTISNNI